MNDLVNIENLIYIIRGQKVMIDSDLAKLYEVETKVLNQSVKRNIERFPSDFMFECDFNDLEDLRSQIVTANTTKLWNYKRRGNPLVFTENGIAMLSSVLNSKNAIAVNIAIMRTFTKLRSFLMMGQDLQERMNKLEEGTTKMFKVVFERMDSYEELLTPALEKDRKKIGLK